MALSTLAQRAVNRVRVKLEAYCGPRLRDLRVFGSMARGDAHSDSDLDLLVLVDAEDRAVRECVFRATGEVEAELGYALPISPCVMSVERFRELLDRELLFALNVEAEGIRV